MSDNADFLFGSAETSNAVSTDKPEHHGKSTQKAARQFAKSHALVVRLDTLIQEQSASLKKLKQQREETFALLFDSYLNPVNRTSEEFVVDTQGASGEDLTEFADAIVQE